ncbi:MAG: sensor histidine kinase, partial [Terriglobales bacterium]
GLYGPISEKGNDRVAEAERSIARLMSMVKGLVDMEKMESGKLSVNLAPVDLSMVVDRSLAEVKGFAEQQSVALESDCGKVSVSGDEDRLVQVMINLLSNAIKFSPSPSTVSISVHPDTNYVEVRIKDAGRGIPEEFRQSLFQRFKQVDVSDAKKLGGTGLGLSICKAIVDAHQGEIGAHNNSDGPGSTFWFRVPIAAEQPESEASQ